ncbi:hypothetical protein [Oscillibacter sp.]|uniref:hypothetical protein n=1 Tax=Oscillibacter sp. TaxID=1945593 RepID=UPI0028A000E4|nr:hypothetical protein [Oscillibacter sp.]
MDIRLKQDLERFFRVYENSTLEVLQKHLPPQVGVSIKKMNWMKNLICSKHPCSIV